MMNRIIFAAGGTGGHIYPAIAVADELKKLKDDVKILFIGAKGRIEEKIIPENGYALQTIQISGFKRSFSYKNIGVLTSLYKAINTSGRYINEFEPDVVYGTGGFVSGPVLWAALRKKIVSVIQNGDYYPGFTTRRVANRVNKVILNFSESSKFFKRKDNLEYFSYPVRQTLERINREKAITYFKLNPTFKTILITGGSQGASSVNDAVLNIYKDLNDAGIQLIWQTGVSDYDKITKYVGENDKCCILKYIDDMSVAYSASDLIICRSGISTIMELASFGSAAVFVPFPFASANHQEQNARRIVESNAAEMILDKDLTSKLKDMVMSLFNNEKKLAEMGDNIKKFADKTAANKIAKFLLNNY